MKEKTIKEIEALNKKLTRIAEIERLDLIAARERKRKHNELKLRLLKYDARILKHEFVSISLKNYDSLIQFDPECTILISDLNYKIQYKML